MLPQGEQYAHDSEVEDDRLPYHMRIRIFVRIREQKLGEAGMRE